MIEAIEAFDGREGDIWSMTLEDGHCSILRAKGVEGLRRDCLRTFT